MSVSESAPPAPVLPASSVVIVKVTEPFEFRTGVKAGAAALARYALRSVAVPLRTSDPVPEPVTVTPLAVVAASVPESTGCFHQEFKKDRTAFGTYCFL